MTNNELFCYHGNIDKINPELSAISRMISEYNVKNPGIYTSKGYVCRLCNDTPIETAHQDGNAIHISWTENTDLYILLGLLINSSANEIVIYAHGKYVHVEIVPDRKNKEIRVVP